MDKLSHYDEAGQAHMVDVSAKAETRREAVAMKLLPLFERNPPSGWDSLRFYKRQPLDKESSLPEHLRAWREAVAAACVELSEAVLAALPSNPKGNPLEVARFAGIQAAKQTSTLIPMCHPLALSFVDVSATVVAGGVAIEATAATVAGTGVEMEAMVAASVAALTVYDMTKALDKGIRIREVVLLRKSGGKSGDYVRGV